MMDYLAIVIEGLAIPFVVTGGLIGEISRGYYNWISNGIKKAKEEADIYLSAAYSAIHCLIFLALPLSPLLLLFFCKNVISLFLVSLLTILTIMCGMTIGIGLLSRIYDENRPNCPPTAR